MFLISNGDLDCLTRAIVCESAESLPDMIELFIRKTGCDRLEVVVNSIGQISDLLAPVGSPS